METRKSSKKPNSSPTKILVLILSISLLLVNTVYADTGSSYSDNSSLHDLSNQLKTSTTDIRNDIAAISTKIKERGDNIMVKQNFKLVTKMDRNIAGIYIVLPNGQSKDICWIKFPDDMQVVDNVSAVNEISEQLKKRIRNSFQ